jgi:serine/threonine protein kinase
MFHTSDLHPPRALVCKTPENPLESTGAYVRIPSQFQGHQSVVYQSTISEIGDVLIKVLKPHLGPQQSFDDVVELEVGLKQEGAPVAELLSYHEWNDDGLTRNAAVYRYYSGGDLFTQILRLHHSKAISPQRTEFIAYSMTSMLCYCLAHLHQKGWVHVDIKPENIFVSHDIESPDCQAYLGDFGNAVRVGTEICRFNTGTESYFPKQDLGNFGYGPAQTSIDLYCVGKVLKKFEFIHALSLHARSVMQRLTAQVATQRPTAVEMLEIHLPAWSSHILSNTS